MIKHGLSRTPEYMAWTGMRYRCLNPESTVYANYGGRGISIDPAWSDVVKFIEDMGPRPSAKHSLERVDNDGSYCKANCVWATCKSQTDNRRNTRRVTYQGVTRTVQDWADLTGINYTTLMRRVDDYGWSVEKALTTSVQQSRDTRHRDTEGHYA